MNGGRRVNGVNIHTPVGPESTFVGVGDIDGDGTDDIVWQHSSRQVHYWSMRGGQRQGGIDLHIPMNRDWRFAGVGDLDGDGTDDILWQHPGGQMLYWRLRGGKVAAGVEIADRPDRGWSLKGVGDVDGDGTDDLVWQHGSGQVHYWKMQGGRRVAGIDVFSPVAAEWNLVGVGDVDAGAAPASAAPAASMPTDMVGLLVAQPWEWIDNGRSLGTITFDRDGSARDTWLNLPQTWRVDANGDLVVAVMFGQWVTRLAYDPQSGSFAGARDRSSRTQDGVRTELRPTRATGR
jgi:ketosteroid isomerase-like protein